MPVPCIATGTVSMDVTVNVTYVQCDLGSLVSYGKSRSNSPS